MIIVNEREVIQMEKLLRKLWLSAEFESDFARDWLAVYEKIKPPQRRGLCNVFRMVNYRLAAQPLTLPPGGSWLPEFQF